MASGHLVTLCYLTELGDVDLHHFVDSGAEVLAVLFAAQAFDLDDLSAFAMWHAQRGVTHLAGLFAEYRAKQLLFGRLVRLALRRDLADEDVTGLDLRTDADDTVLVKIFKSVFADVRDVAGDLFGAKLRITRLDLVFLYMY